MRCSRERSKADLGSVGRFTELESQKESTRSRVQFPAEELEILGKSFADRDVIIFSIEGQKTLDLVNNLERGEYRCFSNLVRSHHADI